MPDHLSFIVLHGFEFAHGIAAPAVPQRIGAVQHQALAAGSHHLAQMLFQLRCIAHAKLLDRLHPCAQGVYIPLAQQTVTVCQTVGEIEGGIGQVKHHVAHRAPFGVHRPGTAHGSRQTVESAPPHPQLAVQRLRGPRSREPRRRSDGSTTAKAQHFAVPQGAHPIEFFTDPIGRWVGLFRPACGQLDTKGVRLSQGCLPKA